MILDGKDLDVIILMTQLMLENIVNYVHNLKQDQKEDNEHGIFKDNAIDNDVEPNCKILRCQE
jgi:hypothetical protein